MLIAMNNLTTDEIGANTSPIAGMMSQPAMSFGCSEVTVIDGLFEVDGAQHFGHETGSFAVTGMLYRRSHNGHCHLRRSIFFFDMARASLRMLR